MTTTEASPVIAPAVKPAGAASSRLPVQPLWIASAFHAQQARLGRRSTYGAAGGLAPVVPHRVTGYDADWLARVADGHNTLSISWQARELLSRE
jgi:hypothetical protein